MAEYRAIRRNNPGNIRSGGARYKGETGSEKGFRVFGDAAWGFRAMFVLLDSYRVRHGLRSIRQVLYRYAPPSDGNDTEAYIAFVCKECGMGDYYPLDTGDHDDMVPVVAAMARMEQGHAVDPALVELGWARYVND